MQNHFLIEFESSVIMCTYTMTKIVKLHDCLQYRTHLLKWGSFMIKIGIIVAIIFMSLIKF